MTAQKRNDEMIRLLSGDFPTRYDWQSNPAQMVGALQMMHRSYDGSMGIGGALMYSWPGDRLAVDSFIGSQALTSLNLVQGDFGVTANGAPYVNLDGVTEAAYVADASWQEVTSHTFFVWHWCRTTTLASSHYVVSKYDLTGNNCSWALLHDNAVTSFIFRVNGTGISANNVDATLSYTELTNTWYFVAGYYNPSTLTRVFVGAATDSTLTVGSKTVGVPASLYDGTAPLCLGSAFNNAPTLLSPWSGLLGIGGARINVGTGTAASYPEINAYAARLFHMTRWFYQ